MQIGTLFNLQKVFTLSNCNVHLKFDQRRRLRFGILCLLVNGSCWVFVLLH
jgi:hypothetical protein